MFKEIAGLRAMSAVLREADLVVIGGGPAAMFARSGLRSSGVKTILVEKARLGGECLIAGCIPSKSLISVAKAYDKAREGAKFGIHATELERRHRGTPGVEGRCRYRSGDRASERSARATRSRSSRASPS